MNKEVESYIFELLEGISEALEFQKRTGNTRLAGDIIERQWGTRSVKVYELDVQETVRKDDAKELYRYL